MAILGFQGFDTWSGADTNEDEGWSFGGGASTQANPRFTGRCLRLTDSDSATCPMGSSLSAFGIAFAMSDREPSTLHRFLQVGDLRLYMTPSNGRLGLYTDAGGTLLFESADGVLDGNYHFIAIAVTIHATTGTFQIWVDNVDITGGQQTGADTLGAGAATVSSFAFVADNTIGPIDYDDVYWTDDLTYHGEKRCVSLYPSGNGNSSDFVGSDGNSTDNYLLVDEAVTDDDTTYVQSNVVGDHDSYAMGNLGDVSEIAGVYVRNRVRKTDAQSRHSQTVLRSGGADYLGTARNLLSVYVGDRTLYLTDPDTAAAWTSTGLDAAEAGVKVES